MSKSAFRNMLTLGAIVLAGCASSDVEERLAKLEQEIRTLKEAVQRLDTRPQVLRDTTPASAQHVSSAGHVETLRVTGGTIPKNEIQGVVSVHMRGVQECYEKALAKNRGAQGTLVYDWVIGPQGNVESAKLVEAESTLQASGAADCILGVVRAMRFPAPKGGPVAVRYPFRFKLNTAPEAE